MVNWNWPLARWRLKLTHSRLISVRPARRTFSMLYNHTVPAPRSVARVTFGPFFTVLIRSSHILNYPTDSQNLIVFQVKIYPFSLLMKESFCVIIYCQKTLKLVWMTYERMCYWYVRFIKIEVWRHTGPMVKSGVDLLNFRIHRLRYDRQKTVISK